MPLHGAFLLVSASTEFNPDTGIVNFAIDFNQPPDFYTLDSGGRPANSFQYYIIGDPTLGFPGKYDSLVRGDEIHLANALRIRDLTPSVPDPAAGGWGPVRGVVPFTVKGTLFTFSAPLATLSDHSVDGRFSYDLLLTEFGASTELVRGHTVVIPESACVRTFLMGILALISLRRKGRTREPQRRN